MSRFTSAPLTLLICSWIIAVSGKTVVVPVGQDAILPCDAGNVTIRAVNWTRSEPQPPKFILFGRKKLVDTPIKGRVQLVDDQLKTGDVSLILKDVSREDVGTYECRVAKDSTLEKTPISIVRLHVSERFPSWAKALLVLLVLLGLGLLVSGALLGHFRHYFMSVYKVEVDSGAESVQLPCKTRVHLPKDARVKWEDGYNKKVHVYQNGSDKPEEQHRYYRGRTEMKRKLQIPGDLSLTLKYLTYSDTGTYTCTVYNREGENLMMKQVVLKVRVCQVEVEVKEGVESVQLPFKTTSNLPEGATVEWTRYGHSDRKVHVYQNSSDQPEKQHHDYKGRTEMKNLLETGDLSLTLKHPKETDTGRYMCVVYNKDGDELKGKIVELEVKGCQVEVEEGEESVQLPFRTTPGLPEDATVKWVCWKPSYSTVHLYENRSDQPDKQDQDYKDRTEMKKDLLETGDLSLTLKHPKETDTGTYRCEVFNKDGDVMREKTVELKVKGNIRNRSSSTDPTPLMADQSV